MTRNQPTVRSRMIGKELRRLREAAGLTLDEAGDFLDRSGSSVSRYENGYHSIRPIELRHMLDIYRVTDPAAREALLSLARQGRQKGWWRNYRDRLSPAALDFASLESDAAQIRSFQPNVIPGLLQTRDYAAALFRAGVTVDTPGEEHPLVEFRMARRRVLDRKPPLTFRAVVGEAALRQRIGTSPGLMKDQLSRLLEETRDDKVRLRVLPFSSGAHPGNEGAFTILDLGQGGSLSVVLVDALTRSWYLEDADEVATYGEVFGRLDAAALSESDSRDFIEHLWSEL